MPKSLFDKIWEAHEVGGRGVVCSTSTCTSSTR